jgi:hypothetical protein
VCRFDPSAHFPILQATSLILHAAARYGSWSYPAEVCQLEVSACSASTPRIDSTILKATARARRWFDDLMSGRAASMAELGQREGIGKRYVSRMIRLAFLAPAMVESIVAGRQPPELTTQLLSTSGDLPLSWRAQEQLFGFAETV